MIKNKPSIFRNGGGVALVDVLPMDSDKEDLTRVLRRLDLEVGRNRPSEGWRETKWVDTDERFL